MNWGASDPQARGPIVASRQPKSLPLRNAIGAFGGAYSIYRSLAIAMVRILIAFMICILRVNWIHIINQTWLIQNL